MYGRAKLPDDVSEIKIDLALERGADHKASRRRRR